ncbi:MAG: septum formation initiator family protein [Candidatus Peregrinibacteria bacterium]
MSSRFSHTSGLTKFIIIVEFALVGYLVYSLTKNVYNSYQVDKHIETFEQENAKIEEENRQKTEDYLYFTSEEYIDKIAKQNLGLVNPGEEVIILSPDVLSDEGDTVSADDGDFATHSGMSNSAQWWSFFFGN